MDEIGDGTLKRTRENIAAWLLDWNGVETNAHSRFGWASLKAEIEIAVANLPGVLADYFELCVIYGYTNEEIADMVTIRGRAVTRAQCASYWHCLLAGVTRRVCDTRVYEQPPAGRGPWPSGWVGGQGRVVREVMRKPRLVWTPGRGWSATSCSILSPYRSGSYRYRRTQRLRRLTICGRTRQ